MSCGVGCRCGSDLVFLWLWYRLAAVAPIQPLAWEPPCVMHVALKSQKKKKIAMCQVIAFCLALLMNLGKEVNCLCPFSGEVLLGGGFRSLSQSPLLP